MEMSMSADDMVDAAFVGFDQKGALVTVPSLPEIADGREFEVDRLASAPICHAAASELIRRRYMQGGVSRTYHPMTC
jgi:hypothetical protein